MQSKCIENASMQKSKQSSSKTHELKKIKVLNYSGLSRTTAIDFFTHTVPAASLLDVCRLHAFKWVY